jgi:regulator of protease activity HflC (stomatin/prohibitin superfamily)
MIVVYKINPDTVKDFYAQMGHDNYHNNYNLHNLLQAKAACVLQSLVARNRVDDVHKTHRISIAQQIQRQLSEDLQQQKQQYGIVIDQVVLQDVKLPEYFSKAIQELHQLDLAIEMEKRKVQRNMIQARGMVEQRRLGNPTTVGANNRLANANTAPGRTVNSARNTSQAPTPTPAPAPVASSRNSNQNNTKHRHTPATQNGRRVTAVSSQEQKVSEKNIREGEEDDTATTATAVESPSGPAKATNKHKDSAK